MAPEQARGQPRDERPERHLFARLHLLLPADRRARRSRAATSPRSSPARPRAPARRPQDSAPTCPREPHRLIQQMMAKRPDSGSPITTSSWSSSRTCRRSRPRTCRSCSLTSRPTYPTRRPPHLRRTRPAFLRGALRRSAAAGHRHDRMAARAPARPGRQLAPEPDARGGDRGHRRFPLSPQWSIEQSLQRLRTRASGPPGRRCAAARFHKSGPALARRVRRHPLAHPNARHMHCTVAPPPVSRQNRLEDTTQRFDRPASDRPMAEDQRQDGEAFEGGEDDEPSAPRSRRVRASPAAAGAGADLGPAAGPVRGGGDDRTRPARRRLARNPGPARPVRHRGEIGCGHDDRAGRGAGRRAHGRGRRLLDPARAGSAQGGTGHDRRERRAGDDSSRSGLDRADRRRNDRTEVSPLDPAAIADLGLTEVVPDSTIRWPGPVTTVQRAVERPRQEHS